MANFLNAEGSSSSGSQSVLIDVAISFGVSYLTAKSEAKKNKALLEKMAQLDTKQAEKLKTLINQSATQLAKTNVIIDFLNEEEQKQLEIQRKKERMLPIIVLGFGLILLGIVFYKLKKQNE